MADKKITAMTELAKGDIAASDPVAVVDLSEAAPSDQNKKVTFETVAKISAFATAADLTASTFHETDMWALVFGNVTRGDGLGGIYYYDAASSETADGISVIAPSDVGAGAGRWLKII